MYHIEEYPPLQQGWIKGKFAGAGGGNNCTFFTIGEIYCTYVKKKIYRALAEGQLKTKSEYGIIPNVPLLIISKRRLNYSKSKAARVATTSVQLRLLFLCVPVERFGLLNCVMTI